MKQLNNTLPSSSGYQRGNRRQEIKNRSRTKGQAGTQPGAWEMLLPGRRGEEFTAEAVPSPSGSVGNRVDGGRLRCHQFSGSEPGHDAWRNPESQAWVGPGWDCEHQSQQPVWLASTSSPGGCQGWRWPLQWEECTDVQRKRRSLASRTRPLAFLGHACAHPQTICILPTWRGQCPRAVSETRSRSWWPAESFLTSWVLVFSLENMEYVHLTFKKEFSHSA